LRKGPQTISAWSQDADRVWDGDQRQQIVGKLHYIERKDILGKPVSAKPMPKPDAALHEFSRLLFTRQHG
jgi:hypothetical protein